MKSNYDSDSIFPVEVGAPSATGGCNVSFQFYVEIDDQNETMPVTASLSYQAYDATGYVFPTSSVSGPTSISVGTPIGTAGKRWKSSTFGVTVNCTGAQSTSCFLSVVPADNGVDQTTGSPFPFTCPCGPGLPAPAPAPAASCLPEIEINIRITGGTPHIDCGCGGKSPDKIERIRDTSTKEISLESMLLPPEEEQENSAEEESDDE